MFCFLKAVLNKGPYLWRLECLRLFVLISPKYFCKLNFPKNLGTKWIV